MDRVSITDEEYNSLCAYYGGQTIRQLLINQDYTKLQEAKNYCLTEYQGKRFISLKGRKGKFESN